jgi:hypothetical protein
MLLKCPLTGEANPLSAGEKVAYRRRFSRSSPPAQGFAPTASPHTPGGYLQILANTGAAKNGPMRDLGRLGGGLIGVSVDRRILALHLSCVRRSNPTPEPARRGTQEEERERVGHCENVPGK